MPRPDTVQFNFKQYMGDDAVLGMDWDATGMHHWLLGISTQQEPPGSLPNDTALLRRWLRSPSDDVWRRVQPQIFSAWTLRGDRWFNRGMEATFERKAKYSGRYEIGTKSVRDWNEKPLKIEKQELVIEPALEVDVGSKSLTQPQVVELLDVQQAATFVCMNLGLSGIQVRLKVLDSVASYSHREKCTYKVAAETLVSLWNKYDSMGLKWKKGIGKWFEESEWRNSERWGKDDVKTDEGIETIRRAARRVAAANGA